LPFSPSSAIYRAFRRPAKGLPWRCDQLISSTLGFERHRGNAGLSASRSPVKESKMPKMKTKSGAKKRFKVTGTGKVLSAFAGKRHGMIKRTNKQIRDHRGTRTMFKTDGDNIRKYFLPNG
jgi:large subunit ribosomal protein L35